MEQCYPFLEDFEICGVIDEKTEKEKLILTHIPTQQKTSIDCFHTVIGELGTDETKLVYKTTEGRSNVLDFESKKLGLFGTAQFFSENGLDAFKTQHGIQDYTQITPWSQKILPFVANYNPEALKLHINHALESCIFEGKPHDPCLLSNLLPFKPLLNNFLQPTQLAKIPDDLWNSDSVINMVDNLPIEDIVNMPKLFKKNEDVARRLQKRLLPRPAREVLELKIPVFSKTFIKTLASKISSQPITLDLPLQDVIAYTTINTRITPDVLEFLSDGRVAQFTTVRDTRMIISIDFKNDDDVKFTLDDDTKELIKTTTSPVWDGRNLTSKSTQKRYRLDGTLIEN